MKKKLIKETQNLKDRNDEADEEEEEESGDGETDCRDNKTRSANEMGEKRSERVETLGPISVAEMKANQ